MNTLLLNQWVEINSEAYQANIRLFQEIVGKGRELCAVVKANAYGHGVEHIVGLAQRQGVDSFAVHSLEEAIELRDFGVTEPILVMGYTPRGQLGDVVSRDLRVVVYDVETLRELDRQATAQNQKVRVHIKAETGTYRQGLEGQRLVQILEELNKSEACIAEGIYCHYANIEDTTQHDFAHGQLETFSAIVKDAKDRGLGFTKVHSACSAAILLFPETYGDMVRLGISQYGLWPSKQTYLSYLMTHDNVSKHVLHPVLSWKCRISQIKDVPADRYVGYGCSYLTTRPTRLAVLPVGYSDGYPRSLSNVGYVLINGRRAQIRGRICMNLCMVDITDIPDVSVEDEVVLIGAQNGAELSVDDVAELAGTINYEVIARIRPGIKRIVV